VSDAHLQLLFAVFDNNRNSGDPDENHSTTTPSRSPALEFGGIQATESSTSPHGNSVGLPPLHAAPGRQISRTPIQKTTTTTTASTWDLMGFTYNPSELAFGRPNNGELGSPSKEHEGLNNNSLTASEMEMRRQRRLRVFQEMTPSKTLQV